MIYLLTKEYKINLLRDDDDVFLIFVMEWNELSYFISKKNIITHGFLTKKRQQSSFLTSCYLRGRLDGNKKAQVLVSIKKRFINKVIYSSNLWICNDLEKIRVLHILNSQEGSFGGAFKGTFNGLY